MDFLELQDRLRAVGSDPHLAWSPRHDGLPATRHCRGAWNLLEHQGRLLVTVRELGRPPQYPPDTTGPEPVEVADEAEGCALLWELVTRESPPGTHRLVGPPPDLLTRFADICGAPPRPPLFGNPFLATRRDESWWVAEVGGAVELRARNSRPEVATAVRVPVPSVADAHRLLLLELASGDRHRWFGAPRLGLPEGLSREQQLARVSGVPLDVLATALLSERGDGVLDVLAEGIALHLLTPDLVRVVEECTGSPAGRYGDGRSAQLGGNGSTGPSWTLREEGGSFELLRTEERSNTARTVARSAWLAEVQARLLTEVGFAGRPARTGSAGRYLSSPGGCVATPSVLAGAPVLWAQREPSVAPEDCGWRFFSAADTGELGAEDAVVVDVNTVVHLSPAVLAVYPLPVGADVQLVQLAGRAHWYDNRTGRPVDVRG